MSSPLCHAFPERALNLRHSQIFRCLLASAVWYVRESSDKVEGVADRQMSGRRDLDPHTPREKRE